MFVFSKCLTKIKTPIEIESNPKCLTINMMIMMINDMFILNDMIKELGRDKRSPTPPPPPPVHFNIQ